ncbi:hypothetical protein RIB2604_02000030 [Aspergillus luchuensis]|uniref:Uncharacterized protein n=1 Tax=Aspergillus kawachii TaxID=1069201 RepID=A0A146FHS4_ASPKA|nr:hypothetical protein RIB2604_02000030 [Aspergillus luchuensis]
MALPKIACIGVIGKAPISDEDPKGSTKSGLREFDLKANPFYRPDEHMATAKAVSSCSSQITDQRFINEVNRIGNSWVPTVASL